MIGLQVICTVYKIEYKNLARELSITPQTINSWLRKKRNIPEARLKQLAAKFPNIPIDYYQKELLKSEEMHIHRIYLDETNTRETVEVPVTNSKGKVVEWREESYGAHDGIINYLENEQEIITIIERVTELIEEDGADRVMINNYLDIVNRGNENQREFIGELLLYLKNKDYFSFTEKYEELGKYLRKYHDLS